MRMSENNPTIRRFDAILVSSPGTFDLRTTFVLIYENTLEGACRCPFEKQCTYNDAHTTPGNLGPHYSTGRNGTFVTLFYGTGTFFAGVDVVAGNSSS